MQNKNNNKLLSRPLGSVYWIEAPAIYLLFIMCSYGLMIALKPQGINESTLHFMHIVIMGLGTVFASTYIWLTSSNTSKKLFTLLARISVVAYLALYATVVIKLVT